MNIRDFFKALDTPIGSGIKKSKVDTNWEGNPTSGGDSKISFSSMDSSYENSPWVRASIDIIANTVSQLDPVIRLKKSAPKEMEDSDEIKAQIEWSRNLISDPNVSDESWSDIIRKTIIDTMKYDRGAWELVPGKEEAIKEIYAVNGSSIHPVVDKRGRFKDDSIAYVQKFEDDMQPRAIFTKDEITIFSQYVTSSSRYGISPIQTLYSYIRTELNAMGFNAKFLDPDNNNLVAGVLGVENIDFEDAKKYQEMWDEKNKNFKGRGRIRFVNSKIHFQDMTLKSTDMQLNEFTIYLLKAISSVLHVPMFMLGFVERVNRSNADNQMSLFWDHAIVPLLNLVSNRFDSAVLQPMGYDKIEYTYEDIEEVDPVQELNRQEKHVKTGIRMINEIRQEMGLEKLPWGDTHTFTGQKWIEAPNTSGVVEENTEEATSESSEEEGSDDSEGE